MIFHVLERLKYHGDTSGYIVQAVSSGKVMFLSAAQAMSCQFDNAVICSNGVLRGKLGIPDKIVYYMMKRLGQDKRQGISDCITAHQTRHLHQHMGMAMISTITARGFT